ncbi:MAG: cell wall hydrolase [Rhizobiaceae bacterium]
MRFSGIKRRGDNNRSLLAPIIIGLGIWIGFPTVAAFQDMASLVSGADNAGTRWNSYIQSSAAGSLHKAEMKFAEGDLATGSISGGGVDAPGIGKVAFSPQKAATEQLPDEDRVNRADKRDRLIEVVPVAPPKDFNAGSVVDRSSSLLQPQMSDKLAMAFVKPAIKGREIKIATTFFVPREENKVIGVSRMLAGLVTNNRPDILATAYAPAKPDYAKASPFASLLRDEKAEKRGRFIPPARKGDHDWVKRPLPASVFSKREQQCLTAGVYFEARGESVAGQAAVAQVILNRVRNPDYPNSVCGVVYQNKSWRNRCQFSFACDGIRDRVASPAHWKTAEEVAQAVTAGVIWFPEVGSATHYHATYVHPRWARTMQRMQKIGQHIFYRTYGGGWS